MSNYYYGGAGNKPIGPIPEQVLLDLFANGAIKQDTMIIKEGSEKWDSFCNVFPDSSSIDAPVSNEAALPEIISLKYGWTYEDDDDDDKFSAEKVYIGDSCHSENNICRLDTELQYKTRKKDFFTNWRSDILDYDITIILNFIESPSPFYDIKARLEGGIELEVYSSCDSKQLQKRDDALWKKYRQIYADSKSKCNSQLVF